MKKNKANVTSRSTEEGQTSARPSSAATLLDHNERNITLGLLLISALIVFRDYIFGKSFYLFKDMAADSHIALYPTINLYSKYLREVGFPSWSFQFGIGQNLLPFILRDPFDLFIYAFSAEMIPTMIVWKEFAKVVITGMIFYTYLSRITTKPLLRIVGSLMYALSGFLIIGSGWHIFSFEALAFALLLLGVENLLQQRSFNVLVIAAFLIGISQPFNIVVYGMFLVIYAALRVYEMHAETFVKSLASLFMRSALCVMLGFSISAVFMIPNVIQLRESPRGSGLSSLSQSLSTKPLLEVADSALVKAEVSRTFSNNLLGVGTDFKGWKNYLEDPTFYCGLLALSMLPLSFMRFDKRQRVAYSIFFGILLIPLVFPYFRYAFWLFSGDYFRAYSLIVTFALVFVALRGLQLRDASSAKTYWMVYGASSAILSICLLLAVESAQRFKTAHILALACLWLYPLLLRMESDKTKSAVSPYGILALLLVELCYTGFVTTHERRVFATKDFHQKVDYNDYSVDAVRYIKSIDPGFYRVSKRYSSSTAMYKSFNDAMMQDYYGISTYNSFNQLDYVKMLNEIGTIDARDEWQSRMISWSGGSVEDLFSVKYQLVRDPQNFRTSFKYDSIAHIGNVTIARNRCALPLGFCYDHYITRDEYKKLNATYKQISLLSAVFVDDADLEKIKALQPLPTIDTAKQVDIDSYSKACELLAKSTLKLEQFSQSDIKGSTELDRPKLMYFSIPADKGWEAEVNGAKVDIIRLDGGMIGLMLPAGKSNVRLSFHQRYFSASLVSSIVGLLVFVGLLVSRFAQQRKAAHNA